MKRWLALVSLLFLASPMLAQHGSAPPGYYPPGYAGDTWTGKITSVNDGTREITLTYIHGGKIETFTGVLKAGLQAKRQDGSKYEVKPSDFPVGGELVVYYTTESKKVDGKKIKTNEIFQFSPVHK